MSSKLVATRSNPSDWNPKSVLIHFRAKTRKIIYYLNCNLSSLSDKLFVFKKQETQTLDLRSQKCMTLVIN